MFYYRLALTGSNSMRLSFTTVVYLSLASISFDQSINVDFGPAVVGYYGTEVALDSGTIWNRVSVPASVVSNLVDSSGSSTLVGSAATIFLVDGTAKTVTSGGDIRGLQQDTNFVAHLIASTASEGRLAVQFSDALSAGGSI